MTLNVFKYADPNVIRQRNAAVFRTNAQRQITPFLQFHLDQQRQQAAKDFRAQAQQIADQHIQMNNQLAQDSQQFRDQAQAIADIHLGLNAGIAQAGQKATADNAEKDRLINATLAALGNPEFTDQERQRLKANPVEALRPLLKNAVINQNIGPLVDIGAPHAGPEGAPLPVVGSIPGLRTLPEAAATLGTAGLGSAPAIVKAGALVGGIGGATGGGEVGQQAAGPQGRAIGEIVGGLGGALAGGVAGGRLGPQLGTAVEENIAARGGLASEVGGTRLGHTGYLDPFEEAKAALIDDLKKQRENIAANKPIRTEERIRRQDVSQQAYDEALARGASEREALVLKRAAQAGQYTPVTGVRTRLSPEQEQAVIDRIKTHDFGRGTGPMDWERDRTLGALFALSNGQAIPENEIASLEKVLGPDFAQEIRRTQQAIPPYVGRMANREGQYGMFEEPIGTPRETAPAPRGPLRNEPLSDTEKQRLQLVFAQQEGRAGAPQGVTGEAAPESTAHLQPSLEPATTASQREINGANNVIRRFLSGGRPNFIERGRVARVYGETTANAMKTEGPTVAQRVYDVAVAPKAILSAFDMSYPLRQGILLAPGHPKEFAKGWAPMVRSFGSEDVAQLVNDTIVQDARGIEYVDGSVHQLGDIKTRVGLVRTLDPSLATSEEAFRSNLAEKIPLLGRVVRASNRAFTTFGNKFRSDVFDTIVQKWQRQGVPIDEQRLQSLSDMLNRFSGRGTLNNEQVTGLLQATWWSPQTRVAPLQAHLQLFNTDGAIRNEAWRNMAAFYGLGSTILGAAALAGGKVSLNPFDTDFGKVVVGNTHVNIWGPLQPQARLIGRLLGGKRFDIVRGNVPTSRADELVNYFRSGLAPEWAAVWDTLKGSNQLGQPLNLDLKTAKRELPNYVLPLAAQDMYNAFKEEGIIGGALVGPASFVGESVSSYPTSAKQQLNAIPKYKSGNLNLSAAELLNAEPRLAEFDQRINEIEQRRGPFPAGTDYTNAIKTFGAEQGWSEREINAVRFLRGARGRTDLINPEYVKFLLGHESDLSEQYPDLFTPKYIDAARQALQKASGEKWLIP